MAANTPLVQIISDDMIQTVVRVTAWDAANAVASNTTVVRANTLTFANSNRPCVVSLTRWTYQCGLGTNTFASLQWVGNAAGSVANSDILIFSGLSGGDFPYLIPNQLVVNQNTANIAAGGIAGDINLQITNPAGNTSLSLLLVLNKEGGAGGGYANGYVQYNDSNFVGG